MVRTAQFRALISADEIILYWSDEILPKQVWLLPQSRHHAASFLLSVVTISQMAFKKQLWIRGTTCIPQKFFSVYCCVWNTMHAGTLFTFLETTYQFHECFAWVFWDFFFMLFACELPRRAGCISTKLIHKNIHVKENELLIYQGRPFHGLPCPIPWPCWKRFCHGWPCHGLPPHPT